MFENFTVVLKEFAHDSAAFEGWSLERKGGDISLGRCYFFLIDCNRMHLQMANAKMQLVPNSRNAKFGIRLVLINIDGKAST